MESATNASLEINKISESIITNSTKRPMVETSSLPEQYLTKLKKLIGDNCGHCNKKCTFHGKLNEVLQCNLCYT